MVFNPSDGERVARLGYEAQDKRAANLIYDYLIEGRLEWFRIADPNAGRVDDILVATIDGDLHGYQVKWANATETISYAEFTHSGKKPSLIAQLAHGWLGLKRCHPDKRVFVHLIHRHIPLPTSAPKAKIPLDIPPPANSSFQTFIRECWDNKSQWLQAGLNGIPPGWGAAMEGIRKETGFSDDRAFLDFIAATDLRFGYQFPHPEEPLQRLAARREKDVDQLARFISKTGGDERRVIEVTRTDLLKQLGWQSRFEFRFKHDFPVDAIYQPITPTVEDLEKSICSFTSGYLALIGTPGSGKSTTLTQTLRYRPGLRVIRYYAYVPGSMWQEARGEAISFLHDFYLALQRHGLYVRSGALSQPETLEELREAIAEQLAVLQQRYREEGLRTLIIVDGLDHIEREQRPERSLLKELPLPESLPEGVIIILGTQTLALSDFSERIQYHLEEPGRTLMIQPLPRQAVSDIITAFPLLTVPNQNQVDIIQNLANGHPLALRYLLANLRNCSNCEAIDKLLLSTQPYDKNIEDNYRVYWGQLQKHQNLKGLLALLSRLRGPFNPEEWLRWVGESQIKELLEKARHYFHEESETRWQFFHNSFRQFILAETRKNLMGKYDRQRDIGYHRDIAEFASMASPQDPWSWEELYHRGNAEEWEKVLLLGTQEYFRGQFLSLRPLDAILEDIGLCLDAARRLGDGLAIIRCALIEKELNDRQENLETAQDELPALLLETRGIDAAIQYVMDGPQVRVGATQALSFAALLVTKGMFNLAESIFNAAEPLDVLNGSTAVENMRGGNIDELRAWADVVHYFRPISKVLTVIKQLRADTNHITERGNFSAFHKELQQEVMWSLAESVFTSGDMAKLNVLKDLLCNEEDGDTLLYHLDVRECSGLRNIDTANEALDRLLQRAEATTADEVSKLYLGDFLFKIRRDRKSAAKWIADIPQPALIETSGNWDWENLNPFVVRIRLNRLLSMLGKPMDPVIAVPDADEKKRGGVLFERCLVMIANVWGSGWAGRVLPPSTVLRLLDPAFHLFSRSYRETREWSLWFAYQRITSDFYTFLINAVAEHGQEALNVVGLEFARLWQAQPRYWQPGLQRSIALELHRKGCTAIDLKQHLDRIGNLYGVSDDVKSLASERSKHAFAWIEAGSPAIAQSLLPLMFKNSFGIVYEKDYRFSNWTTLLAKTTAELPGFTAEDIRRFASALVVLEDTGRCRGIKDAAVELMTLTALWNPGYALKLKDWLLMKQSIHYTDALEGILSAAAVSPNAPVEMVVILASHLLLPFTGTTSSDLPRKLAQRCGTQSSDCQPFLETLVRTLDTKVFPSERSEWWRGIIEGLQRVSVDVSWFQKKLNTDTRKKTYESDLTVHLKSGEKLTPRDAMLRINNGSDLLEFAENVEKVGWFPWDQAVAKVLDTLASDQVYSIKTILEPFEKKPFIETLLAQRLKALGMAEEADSLLQSVLEQSSPHGWDKWWDGGSRLSAMQAIVALDPEEGCQKALNTFANDYLTTWRSPGAFLENLEAFLPLLFKEPPLTEIWREVREHIYQLHEFSDLETLPPAETKPEGTWQTVMMRLVSDALKIEITEVRDEAHRAFSKICMNSSFDSDSHQLLQQMLNGSDMEAFHALAVLHSVWEPRSEYITALNRDIIRLCNAPNMTVRAMAEDLARALNLSMPQPQNKPLPATYSFELPEFDNIEEVTPFEALPPGASFPDVDDPLEMIRPFQDEFELVSQMSGVPFQNLVYRAASLMKSLSPPEKWSKQAEEKMKGWLKAADLELPYHRLRPQQALRAFQYVVAELVDAKSLPADAVPLCGHFLRRHDRIMSKKEPLPRPMEVVLCECDQSGFYDKTWVENCADGLAVMPEKLKDGRFILGDLTRSRHLDWECPTEFRMGMVCHPDWQASHVTDAYHFFPYGLVWCAEDYPQLNVPKMPSLAIYGHPRGFEFGGQEWLAFNPRIAYSLRWRFTPSGLFRWEDAEGRLMVESMWWKDGAIERQPYHDDTCSEGWLVLATPEAYETIRNSLKHIARVRLVARKSKEGQKSQFERTRL